MKMKRCNGLYGCEWCPKKHNTVSADCRCEAHKQQPDLRTVNV